MHVLARRYEESDHEPRWVEDRIPAAQLRTANAPSTERQPWRVFENSLAVRFISRRRQSWSQQIKSDVLSGLESREVIRQVYFKLDSALRDLLAATAGASLRTGNGAAGRERLAALRAAAAPGGPLANQGVFLIPFAHRMELMARPLDLIVHGFLEVREAWSRQVMFEFKLGREKLSFDASALGREATSLNCLAVIALPHLKRIRKDME